MAGPNSAITKADGTLNFSGGVNSIAVPTIQSERNPNGLKRNELGWLINGTVRDGGITPRAGWKRLGTITDGSAIYQGGFMYRPVQGNPYLMLAIGGNIIKLDPDVGPENVTISAAVFSVPNPGPWTITLRNRSVVVKASGTSLPAPPLVGSATPAGFPVPGTNFSDASPQYLGSVGMGFTPFVIPAVGDTVTFQIAAPYTGAVGDILQLTGNFTAVY